MNTSDYFLNFDSFGITIRTLLFLWAPAIIVGIIALGFLWKALAWLFRKTRSSTQQERRIGVRVSGYNNLAVAFSGLVLYAGIAFLLYALALTFNGIPDNLIGTILSWAYSALWLLAWIIGWDNTAIPADEFGTIWILPGFRLPILLAAGPYWSLPKWLMRVKTLIAIFQTSSYGDIKPFVIQTMGDLASAPVTPTSLPAPIVPAGPDKSIIEVKIQASLRWSADINIIGEYVRFLGLSWDKDISLEEAFKKVDKSISKEVIKKIRAVAAKRPYTVVMEEKLMDVGVMVDENGNRQNVQGKDEVILILNKDEDNIFYNTGTIANSLAITSAELVHDEDKRALAGKVREGGEQSSEMKDAETNTKLIRYYTQYLINTEHYPDNEETKAHAMKLALQSHGKAAPVQYIEVKGTSPENLRLNINQPTAASTPPTTQPTTT